MAHRTAQLTMKETNGHAQIILENSIEYKLLRAYSEKKESPNTCPSNGTMEAKSASSVPSEEHHAPEKKKKKKRIRIRKLISCIRPAKEDKDNCLVTEAHKRKASNLSPEEEVEDIVNKLTKITNSVRFSPNFLQCDSNDVVERIVDILREQGDQLNEEIKKNHVLMQKLEDLQSYSFFKKLVKTFFSRLSPEEIPSTQEPEQARIALVCELTSRLMIMDRHPMNRVLGFGTQYLQENYTAWVVNQGGYGQVFKTDDEDDEEVQ